MDDWLLLAQSRVQCIQQLGLTLNLCSKLGFTLNLEKSDFVPAQTFTFLGMTFDTLKWKVSPSWDRCLKLQTVLRSLQLHPHTSARSIASLLGTMESMSPILTLGRLFKRPLQRAFRDRWNQREESWDKRIVLGPWFQQATAQWLILDWLAAGDAISFPQPEETLFTDASNAGWGGHVGSLTANGSWNPTQSSWHINRLELEAVILSLEHFLPRLQNKSVLLNTDNTTVACYINRQGGARSPTLSLRTEALLLWCQKHQIRLVARYVPGRLNILADALSRSHTVVSSEWTLDRNILSPVWERWFKPMVDLFASRFNHRLPIYVSPVPDPMAWKIDALTFSWENLQAYAFPPFPLLGKVLKKAREERPSLILIAPNWPSRPWYPDLLELSHIPPLKLEVRRNSVVQPRSGIPHADPQKLNLHAWLLCGNLCLHEELHLQS